MTAFHTNQTSVTIATSTTSASGTIPANAESRIIRVLNASTGIAYVRTGSSTPTAVATDQFIGAGETVLLEKPADHNLIAAILDAGTGKLVVAPAGQ